MRILVYDVAAENGGALSILKQYYSKCQADSENEYVFVLSGAFVEPCPNIRVIVKSEVKRSWFHRLYFDWVTMPKMVKELEIDAVLSLQNMRIPRINIVQSVYFHNMLALTDEQFSIFSETKLWIYRNVIGRMIRRSLKRAHRVIVQADWIKNACVKRIGISPERISVEAPDIVLPEVPEVRPTVSECVFFFPASGVYFKNHRAIVAACDLLKECGADQYKVVFTLQGRENKHISHLFDHARQNSLPIEFCGQLTPQEMVEKYCGSILLFPSYIETIGLPLLEARHLGAEILCADEEYARSALDGYGKAEFFVSDDIEEIADLMMKRIRKK